MSGIVAVFDPEGDVSRTRFEQLLDTLDYRGHHGRDAVVRDRVAVGHQHFYTTPSERGERQPVEADGVLLALDGRVDNRAELLRALRASRGDPSADESDARLLLRAYRLWGEEFTDRVRGVYAVVLWDGREDRLVCVRDRVGVRRLYYATPGDRFVVASEASTLVEHPDVPATPDLDTVAQYVRGRLTRYGATFYDRVDAVERAERLVVDADGVRSDRYWDPTAGDALSADRPLADQFRDLLRDAVECRLRGVTTPALSLSGGLDSTSIAAAARRHLDDESLRAYSIVFDDVDDEALATGERARIEAVRDEYDLAVEFVDGETHWPGRNLGSEGNPVENPCSNPMRVPMRELYRRAAGDGHRVVLRGEGGNLHDGERQYYLDLLRRGEYRTAVEDALADPLSLIGVARVVASSYLAERGGPDDFDGLGYAGRDPFCVDSDGLAALRSDGARDDRSVYDDVSLPGTAELRSTFETYQNRRTDFKLAQERRDALAQGVELRYPLYDARIVEFLFSLPVRERFRAGVDKHLFRRAMEGILPEAVRTNTDETPFDPAVDVGFRRRRSHFEEVLFDGELVERGVVDEVGLEQLLAESLRGGSTQGTQLWKLYNAERWLRSHG